MSVLKSSVRPELHQYVAEDADLRRDLGLDSLAIASVLFACAEALHINAAETDISLRAVRKVRDVLALVAAFSPIREAEQ